LGKKPASRSLLARKRRKPKRADAVAGPPPTDLSAHGRRLWQETAADAPWITPADRGTLKRYVAAVMDCDVARDAQAKHEAECFRDGKKNPLILITKHGAQQSPYIAMARRAAADALKHAPLTKTTDLHPGDFILFKIAGAYHALPAE